MLEFSSSSKLLVFAVHPDDEVLAAGGMIQRCLAGGGDVIVLFVTNGESNPWPQRFFERRLRIGPSERQRWAARRKDEAIASVKLLGVGEQKVFFLNLPDQGLTSLALEGGTAFVNEAKRWIDEFSPTHLVIPSLLDSHPDHGSLTLMLQESGIIGQLIKDGIKVLSYVLHPAEFHYGDEVSGLYLNPEEIEKKREAIRCHKTQMILSQKRFLGYAKREEFFSMNAVDIRKAHCTADDIGSITAKFSIQPIYRQLFGLRLQILFSSNGSFNGIDLPLSFSATPFTVIHGNSEHAGAVHHSISGTTLQMRCSDSAPKIFVKISQPAVVFDYLSWTSLSLPR